MNVQWQAILSEPIPNENALDNRLEEAVRQHARFVYQIAYAVLRNQQDAEDATQETFVRVLRYRRQLDEVQDTRAWLARIAWRVAVARKKNTVEISLDETAEIALKLYTAGAEVEKIASDKQMLALLEQLIATLPKKLRETMVLSLDEDLSLVEIGKILDIPESSVRTRLFRARRLLRQKLSSLLGGKNERRKT
jgi:RNA polymerase sigma-70 factor, ECF subfamily